MGNQRTPADADNPYIVGGKRAGDPEPPLPPGGRIQPVAPGDELDPDSEWDGIGPRPPKKPVNVSAKTMLDAKVEVPGSAPNPEPPKGSSQG
jgi:hypothetical protein